MIDDRNTWRPLGAHRLADVRPGASRIESSSTPGQTYDVFQSPQGWWSCECDGFLYRDKCRHVTEARAYLARRRREEARR